ncbi:UDP-N-acetylmuramate dehydrogenase [Stutzerimonas kirkiae]|uniref:UDP-N-acetylenolpyruvoylglucosamine reductase n=1 Tax=Stutzerimonas kirkiae TaxID=2211392 RepID=A0A4Q9RBX0_9GAMM|nr:UDP-N-acetylmuramate dehydrogenase [Stutzerimonas kirkiae]TBU97749.1 UDP-N-acetylenolpyruvoylglucosamine reductase [Stutzerimonas kirkiae]TBV04900.1 UDP-N-acetylenolpyruvoylglucosamine reductase [Stutzerimonas kirkiae]TBV12036.1 UDP-N-acetylenolpyruvoylglucosamine reductase [Stutzerimonas kirkiae]TBV14955.1 UDP-N-acetylenolpyruvoylglucosamine reductase [Stutzerimonas kirkiae]
MSLVVHERYSLAACNTFGVRAEARWYAEAHDDAEVLQALLEAGRLGVPLQVLGGGSNIVLTRDQQALVLRMCSRGVRVLADDGEQALVEAEAGEPWHPFVRHCLAAGFSGLENLSLIPGTVGAAPIQNVGAYGVEVKDVLHELTALDRQTGELRIFSRADCAFAYRDSLFKRQVGRFLILRVRFALRRHGPLCLDYGPIRQRLAALGIERPTAADVSRVVCAIRAEKLPDPKVLGNAGSFFKNPLVSASVADRLRAAYPSLVAYPQADGQVKLAAGWLIEQAGWKGYRDGDVGVHHLQALVLVNHGQATGEQVIDLARRIQQDIAQRFGVALEMEPNIL